jgi:hypothetical protein
MHRLALSLALLTFFLNPGVACTSSEEPTFTFGEAEMRAAVEGTWLLTLRSSDGSFSDTTLQIAESSKAQAFRTTTPSGHYRTGVIRSASACGSRTFVKSAGACTDLSDMPLDVTFVSGNPRFQNALLSGRFLVGDLTFVRGMMNLGLGDVSLGATVAPDGTASPLGGASSDGSTVVSLMRTAR